MALADKQSASRALFTLGGIQNSLKPGNCGLENIKNSIERKYQLANRFSLSFRIQNPFIFIVQDFIKHINPRIQQGPSRYDV